MEQRAAERQQKVGVKKEASTWNPKAHQFKMDVCFVKQPFLM